MLRLPKCLARADNPATDRSPKSILSRALKPAILFHPAPSTTLLPAFAFI